LLRSCEKLREISLATLLSPNVDTLIEGVVTLWKIAGTLTNETCHNAQELALVNSERT